MNELPEDLSLFQEWHELERETRAHLLFLGLMWALTLLVGNDVLMWMLR